MTDVSTAILQDELGDRYTIERELGRGGMGAVYLDQRVRLAALAVSVARGRAT